MSGNYLHQIWAIKYKVIALITSSLLVLFYAHLWLCAVLEQQHWQSRFIRGSLLI